MEANHSEPISPLPSPEPATPEPAAPEARPSNGAAKDVPRPGKRIVALLGVLIGGILAGLLGLPAAALGATVAGGSSPQ